jgi:hypothetical protein
MARTVSQAGACRRYGIAKGSMSRHIANHVDQPQAARSDALDVLDHVEADPVHEPAKIIPPPPMIERSETADNRAEPTMTVRERIVILQRRVAAIIAAEKD